MVAALVAATARDYGRGWLAGAVIIAPLAWQIGSRPRSSWRAAWPPAP
jgi:hypothetical protein